MVDPIQSSGCKLHLWRSGHHFIDADFAIHRSMEFREARLDVSKENRGRAVGGTRRDKSGLWLEEGKELAI